MNDIPKKSRKLTTFTSLGGIPKPLDNSSISAIELIPTNFLGTIGSKRKISDITNSVFESRIMPTIKSVIENFLPDDFIKGFRQQKAQNSVFYEDDQDAKNALVTEVWEKMEPIVKIQTSRALKVSLDDTAPNEYHAQNKASSYNIDAYTESFEDLMSRYVLKKIDDHENQQELQARIFVASCVRFSRDQVQIGICDIVDQFKRNAESDRKR